MKRINNRFTKKNKQKRTRISKKGNSFVYSSSQATSNVAMKKMKLSPNPNIYLSKSRVENKKTKSRKIKNNKGSKKKVQMFRQKKIKGGGRKELIEQIIVGVKRYIRRDLTYTEIEDIKSQYTLKEIFIRISIILGYSFDKTKCKYNIQKFLYDFIAEYYPNEKLSGDTNKNFEILQKIFNDNHDDLDTTVYKKTEDKEKENIKKKLIKKLETVKNFEDIFEFNDKNNETNVYNKKIIQRDIEFYNNPETKDKEEHINTIVDYIVNNIIHFKADATEANKPPKTKTKTEPEAKADEAEPEPEPEPEADEAKAEATNPEAKKNAFIKRDDNYQVTNEEIQKFSEKLDITQEIYNSIDDNKSEKKYLKNLKIENTEIKKLISAIIDNYFSDIKIEDIEFKNVKITKADLESILSSIQIVTLNVDLTNDYAKIINEIKTQIKELEAGYSDFNDTIKFNEEYFKEKFAKIIVFLSAIHENKIDLNQNS